MKCDICKEEIVAEDYYVTCTTARRMSGGTFGRVIHVHLDECGLLYEFLCNQLPVSSESPSW